MKDISDFKPHSRYTSGVSILVVLTACVEGYGKFREDISESDYKKLCEMKADVFSSGNTLFCFGRLGPRFVVTPLNKNYLEIDCWSAV